MHRQHFMFTTPTCLIAASHRVSRLFQEVVGPVMMRDTVALAVPGPSAPQSAAEALSAPRPLLERPQQPDQPLQHHLPADASGLARTIRGPLAPELFELIEQRQRAATPPMDPTQLAAPAAAAAAAATAGAMPRSTAWRHRLQAEKERRAREFGLTVKPMKKVSGCICSRCGQPRTKEYGHSRYKRESFCARADGRTVEQWRQDKLRSDREAPPPPPP